MAVRAARISALVAEGRADFVALGRALLADPHWPQKASEGRTDWIRRCFSCNYCAGTRAQGDLGVRCVINPEVGQGDVTSDPEPARKKKKGPRKGGLE